MRAECVTVNLKGEQMKCPKCGDAMAYCGSNALMSNPPIQETTWACHECKVKTTDRKREQVGFFEGRSLEGYEVVPPPPRASESGTGSPTVTVSGGIITGGTIAFVGGISREDFDALLTRVEALEKRIGEKPT